MQITIGAASGAVDGTLVNGRDEGVRRAFPFDYSGNLLANGLDVGVHRAPPFHGCVRYI